MGKYYFEIFEVFLPFLKPQPELIKPVNPWQPSWGFVNLTSLMDTHVFEGPDLGHSIVYCNFK